MSAPRRRRHDPHALAATEHSIWDVYNNVADMEDDELIKDWNDSLNFLLVFAAIFAAVLTALVVESMRLLQGDPQDVTNTILLRISAQLANNSIPPYESIDFDPPQTAIIINALLFASLCCSLVAALAAVLALQWVNEYDARIDTVDARKRAIIRHFRFLGVLQWKMGEIIAVLPLLLHASVFLFFAGIIEWLGTLHPVVFYICLGGACLAMVFYATTVTLSAFFGNSPFRSPMARAFRYMIYGSAWSTANIVGSTMHWISTNVPGVNPRVPPDTILKRRSFSAFRHAPSLWLHHHLFGILPSLQKLGNTKLLENERAGDDTLQSTTIKWAVSHVELANQSTHRLVQILKHANPLFEDESVAVPWDRVVNQVSDFCLDKAASHDFLPEDLITLRILVKNWLAPYFQKKRTHHMETVNKQIWDKWDSSLQLIGPLWLSGKVQGTGLGKIRDDHMNVLVSIVEARCASDSKSAATQLVEATRGCKLSTPRDRKITSYAIDSMSIYLWTHEIDDNYITVAERLAEMLDVPPGQLSIGLKQDISIPLTLSALYSVAYGNKEKGRRYWASKHQLYPVSPENDRLPLVQKMHSAITSRIAADLLQETSYDAVVVHLQNLCRFLAYTPCGSESTGFNARKRIEILELLPHSFSSDHPSTQDNNITALPSMIWIQKASGIPRIHEYLEVLLVCRRNFPTIQPVWRTWCYSETDTWPIWPAPYAYQKWLNPFRLDRRLTHVMLAFDDLISIGCTPEQHLVMIQLVVNDLQDPKTHEYKNYFTDERKDDLRSLKDPALRLVGARAADIAYSGTLPQLEDDEWNRDPWIEAVKYWCERYQGLHTLADDVVLYAALVQPNSALHSVVVESSTKNPDLKGQLQRLLVAKLAERKLVNGTLVLTAHAAIRTAPWFSEYLVDNNIVSTVLEVIKHASPLRLRVLPFLAILASFIETPEDLEIILTTVHAALENSNSHPSPEEVDEVAAVFENLMRSPPQWAQSRAKEDEEWKRRTSEHLNGITYHLRRQGNLDREMIRWTGPLSSRAIAWIAQQEEAMATGVTTVEDTVTSNSETTNGMYEIQKRVIGGLMRKVFRRGEGSSDDSTSDEEEEEEEEGVDEESSDEEDEELLEEYGHKFKEGKGGGAGFFSCSAALCT